MHLFHTSSNPFHHALRRCKQYGHLSKDCRQREDARKARQTCYVCGQKGHTRRECPGIEDGGKGQSKYRNKHSKKPKGMWNYCNGSLMVLHYLYPYPLLDCLQPVAGLCCFNYWGYFCPVSPRLPNAACLLILFYFSFFKMSFFSLFSLTLQIYHVQCGDKES